MKHGYLCDRKEPPEYRAWVNMRIRCNDPHYKYFRRYGGRGIKVCKQWEEFKNFIADMGPRPSGTSLDRKDNNGDYTPENCRWATPSEQSNNRRSNYKILFQEQTMTMSQWCTFLKINRAVVKKRFQAKWSIERALTTPVRAYK